MTDHTEQRQAAIKALFLAEEKLAQKYKTAREAKEWYSKCVEETDTAHASIAVASNMNDGDFYTVARLQYMKQMAAETQVPLINAELAMEKANEELWIARSELYARMDELAGTPLPRPPQASALHRA